MLNQTIQTISETTYSTNLITIWLGTLLILFLVTALFKSKNMKWGRFLGIWFGSAVLSGLLTITLYYSPNLIKDGLDSLISSVKGAF